MTYCLVEQAGDRELLVGITVVVKQVIGDRPAGLRDQPRQRASHAKQIERFPAFHSVGVAPCQATDSIVSNASFIRILFLFMTFVYPFGLYQIGEVQARS